MEALVSIIIVLLLSGLSTFVVLKIYNNFHLIKLPKIKFPKLNFKIQTRKNNVEILKSEPIEYENVYGSFMGIEHKTGEKNPSELKKLFTKHLMLVLPMIVAVGVGYYFFKRRKF